MTVSSLYSKKMPKEHGNEKEVQTMVSSADLDTKELRHELFEKTDAIECSLLSLKKASIILNHWFEDYSFYKNPDPRLAIIHGASIPRDSNIHQAQSFHWFNDYENIIGFIGIVNDYVYEAKELLSEVMQAAE